MARGAAELSKRVARKGGLARAEALDSETRREIASRAAAARWGDMHVANNTGEIKIGNLRLSCAVLDDKTRLISQSTFLQALGRNPEKSRRTRGASAIRAPFLLANNLQPFIGEELRDMEEPIPYRVNGESGRAWGYRAEMLPLVCDVYLEARREGVLLPSQRAAARAAEVLLSGLARVGIVALVDEATGYQETRARDELQIILSRSTSGRSSADGFRRFPTSSSSRSTGYRGGSTGPVRASARRKSGSWSTSTSMTSYRPAYTRSFAVLILARRRVTASASITST